MGTLTTPAVPATAPRTLLADPNETPEDFGVEPGSVTPFAAINDKSGQVTVVLDEAMMRQPTLNFHPLINTGTTTISRDGLLKFLEATGHRPRIEPVSGTSM